MDKSVLIKRFQKDPDKYWKVNLFDEGWVRKKCKVCGRYFWTLDPDRDVCDDHGYTFIGNPATNRKMDYVETWKEIEKFFVKEGHTSIPRYPVICRWFPGLYFTIASIVDFMRKVGPRTNFEMPANPLVVPQVCLRFNDIPNIGVSGRHMSSFVMVGQHSLYHPENGEGYWKDKTIELDYRLLTEVFRVKPEDIVWHEDVWLGPSAFGTSLEYFVKGIEVGNAVFTQFSGTPEKFEEMQPKVVDMGAGHERFTWMTQGTPTIYDAVFGPVIPKMIKFTGVEYDKELFLRYAKLSNIDATEVDPTTLEADIASSLGLSLQDLKEKISPIQAIYAIADHARTLGFAISDGGIPSNVGGGYNLRVIFRRALNLMEKNGFGFELGDIVEMHAKHLKPLFPELGDHLDEIWEIFDVEKQKHKKSMARARRYLDRLVASGKGISTGKLIELYESQGITPELVQEVASSSGKLVKIPPDFYIKLTERHMSEKQEKEELEVDVSGIPPTRKLYRENWKVTNFKAKVIAVNNIEGEKWYAFDQTAFYPISGGQDHDVGTVNGKPVIDVRQFGDVVLHKVVGSLSVGDIIDGNIDWKRRLALTRNHTATHVINGSARRVLGDHVWQAGAEKKVDKARLDISHYALLTKDQIRQVEALANKVVLEDRAVEKEILPRVEAENKYGFRIYQGGVIPFAELRIVNIVGWDVEACGGTHVDKTSEIGNILLYGQERVQDGVVRLNFVAGDCAEAKLDAMINVMEKVKSELGVSRDEELPGALESLFEEWKLTKKALEKYKKEKAGDMISNIQLKSNNRFRYFVGVFDDMDIQALREVSKKLSADDVFLFLIGLKDKTYIFSYAGKSTGINAGQIVKEAAASLGGGGGGPAERGEGAAPAVDKHNLEEVLKVVEEKVNR